MFRQRFNTEDYPRVSQISKDTYGFKVVEKGPEAGSLREIHYDAKEKLILAVNTQGGVTVLAETENYIQTPEGYQLASYSMDLPISKISMDVAITADTVGKYTLPAKFVLNLRNPSDAKQGTPVTFTLSNYQLVDR